MKGLLFTYLLTYGGAAAALFNPFIGLLIYVAFAILRPQSLWYFSVPEGNYSRTVAIGLVIGWAIHGFGRWDFGRAKPIVWAIIAFVGWAALSAALIATNKERAWTFVEILAKIVLPFVVGITTIDSLSKLKQLAWVILLCQGYLALEFNQWYLDGYNRLRIFGFGDMDNNSNAIALVTSLGLAVFLGMASTVWWQKAIAYGAAALMVHAILISFSRGGMLSLIVTIAVSFMLMPKRPIHYIGLIVAVVLMFRFTGTEVFERFATSFVSAEERDEAAESRLVMWRACIETMMQQPLGVGAANWGEVVVRYGFPRGKLAHSLWLQTGAELGVVGLALLVVFYGGCCLRLWSLTRPNSDVPDPWFRHLARMVIASLVGFAVSAQFVSLDLLEHPYYITLIGAGLLKLSSVAGNAQPADFIQAGSEWEPADEQPESQELDRSNQDNVLV
ncbi:MAG: O-antigen ligase family protein [Gemmataceae bacterium]|nr:O-antigen ligase family protein [Gemmataceae bacterium]